MKLKNLPAVKQGFNNNISPAEHIDFTGITRDDYIGHLFLFYTVNSCNTTLATTKNFMLIQATILLQHTTTNTTHTFCIYSKINTYSAMLTYTLHSLFYNAHYTMIHNIEKKYCAKQKKFSIKIMHFTITPLYITTR